MTVTAGAAARLSLPSAAIFWLLLLAFPFVSAEKQTIDLGSLLGGESGEGEGCANHCSSHTVPAPKPRIRPYSNGCSVPPFLQQSLGDYSHFTSCCDLHDTCYMTCGATKGFCDKEFGRCMKQTCMKKYGKSGQRTQECKGLADTFVLGVSMFGCDGYLGYQREGCDCLPKPEAALRVGEYARDFYDHYNATHPLPDAIVQKYLNGASPDNHERHGELLFRLYRKYPKSIEIVSRDGQAGRDGATRFPKKKKKGETKMQETHAGHTLEDDEAHKRARVARQQEQERPKDECGSEDDGECKKSEGDGEGEGKSAEQPNDNAEEVEEDEDEEEARERARREAAEAAQEEYYRQKAREVVDRVEREHEELLSKLRREDGSLPEGIKLKANE